MNLIADSRTMLPVWVCALILIGWPPGACKVFAQVSDVNRIALVFDGPWYRNDEVAGLYRDEIRKLAGSEFNAVVRGSDILVGDWTYAKSSQLVGQAVRDPEIDLVITTGLLSAGYLARQTAFQKPVISTFMLEPQLQQLPQHAGRTGIHNFNFLSTPPTLGRDIGQFLELTSFKKLALLIGSPFVEQLSGIREQTQLIAGRYQVEITLIQVGDSPERALERLSEVDAVYLGPVIHLGRDEHFQLIEGINERGIPSFSYLGEVEVREGAYASLNPDMFPRLARRVALHIQRILLGDDAGQLNTSFASGERLYINMQTARDIDLYPPLELSLEAELINDQPAEIQKNYTLEGAVELGITANLALASKQVSTQAAAHDVDLARSTLLPHLEVSGTGLLIDEDRAEASFGSQAQRTLSGSVKATQVLFSEPAYANVSIQKKLQSGRKSDLMAARLDITLQVALSYLNVVRAKTLQTIQQENLRLTRSFLELAKVRETIGQSGPGEVYRLESQLAINRKSLVEARAMRKSAEIALNQVLNRPQEERFETADGDMGTGYFTMGRDLVTDLIRTERQFERLRDFMVAVGLESSPELQTLDEFRAARERRMKSARNAFWSPTIAIQGQGSRTVAEGGAGTEGPASQLPPDIVSQFPGIQDAFPGVDETFWNVGISLSLPIFTGLSRSVEKQKANLELRQIEIELEQTRTLVEQNIRTQLHSAGTSFAAIKQSEVAADAADQYLELVRDAYAQGLVSVVELLEAQNAALVSTELLTNAKYDFLANLMRVERAIGQFEFFWTDADREAFFSRLEQYMAAQDG